MAAQVRLLTDAEFLVITNDEDFLSLSIRGHQAIEDVLNAAISEALYEAHALEVGKLTFSLKIDLAVALHVIRAESRSLFVYLNKTRNQFAHRSNAAFGEQEAVELRNCLPVNQRAGLEKELSALSPQDLLRRAIAIAFIELRAALDQIRHARLEDEVLHELVVETVGKANYESRHRSAVDKKIADRIAKKKADRGW